MNAWAFAVDATALGRRMLLGAAAYHRHAGWKAFGSLLVAALALGGLVEEGLARFAFGALSLAAAFLASYITTSGMLKARQVFSGLAMPSAALHAWRRGWLQGQGLVTLALMAGMAVVTLASGERPRLGVTIVFGSWMLLLQAEAALVAGVVRGRGFRALAATAAVALPIVAGLILLAARGARDAMWLVPLACGLGGLGLVWRWLGVRRASMSAFLGNGPELARLQPTAPQVSLWRPRPAWSIWLYTAASLIGCGSQGANVAMRSDQPLVRAALLFWFVVMTQGIALMLRPHWREMLSPGGPRRDRCGRLVFLRMLRVYAIVGLPVLLLTGGLALAAGMGLTRLLAVDARLVCELVVASALGAWMAGAPALATRSRGPTWLCLAVLLLAILVLLLGSWHHPELADPDLIAAARHDALLLLLVPPVLWMADRAWSRRSLFDAPLPAR